jgi:hypothetical protein
MSDSSYPPSAVSSSPNTPLLSPMRSGTGTGAGSRGGRANKSQQSTQQQQQSGQLSQNSTPMLMPQSGNLLPFTGAGTLSSLGSDSTSLLSSNPLLSSSLGSSLSFPFSPLPPSTMPLSAMGLGLGGLGGMSLTGAMGGSASASVTGSSASSSSLQSAPPLDLAAMMDVQPRKAPRGRKPAAAHNKNEMDAQPLHLWLQALDTSNAAANAAASLSAAANPFASFASLSNFNLGAAFYQQLAAASAQLPALLSAANTNALNQQLNQQLLASFMAAPTNSAPVQPSFPTLPLTLPLSTSPPLAPNALLPNLTAMAGAGIDLFSALANSANSGVGGGSGGSAGGAGSGGGNNNNNNGNSGSGDPTSSSSGGGSAPKRKLPDDAPNDGSKRLRAEGSSDVGSMVAASAVSDAAPNTSGTGAAPLHPPTTAAASKSDSASNPLAHVAPTATTNPASGTTATLPPP